MSYSGLFSSVAARLGEAWRLISSAPGAGVSVFVLPRSWSPVSPCPALPCPALSISLPFARNSSTVASRTQTKPRPTFLSLLDSERARQIDQEQKDEEVARKLLLADRQMQEVWMKKKREITEKDEEVARRMAEEERDAEKM